MKTKLVIVILAVAFVGLLIALFAMKQTSEKQFKKDTYAILDFSNQLVTARADLDELGQVNLKLTNDLTASHQETLDFSNRFAETSGTLAGARASLQDAQGQITNLNQRITGLAAQNKELDQRSAALASAITSLNSQIADTQLQLADSQTNNVFLEKELQRQTSARIELESKFNNLTTVRTQVKKLKEDLLVARRLQWMHEGTDPSLQLAKGGQQLMQRPSPVLVRPPHYDLNVEVSSDGAIRVIPLSTNALATMSSPEAQ
jgi:DNA repair exonuclease SbcCD ATPase subunit